MGIVVAVVICLLVIAALFYGFYSTRNSFRRMLPGELHLWLAEGIIGEEEARRIRERYKLADIQTESQATLINAIFIFGAVLIACGIIAFVAAHWDGIPRFWKLALIIGVMVAVHIAGFYFWKFKATLPRLGHALVLLGTLIFGANIALVAQIFHLSANFYDGFLIWTIGALAIAFVSESIPLADLAVIASFVWFCGWKTDNPNGIPFYPWLILLFFMPFAYRQSSRSLHFLTLLGWGAALVISGFTAENSSALLAIALIVLTAIIYWSYADWLSLTRKRAPDQRGHNEDFKSDSKFLGVLSMGALSYILSFKSIIAALRMNWSFSFDWNFFTAVMTCCIVVFSVIYGYRLDKSKHRMVAYSIMIGVAAIILAVIGFNWFLGLIIGTILSNLAVVLIGAFLFRSGLHEMDRRYFWLGLGLLVLEVVSRFFEYDTGLLLKSLAFVLAGLALIAGGVWFEKKYQRRAVENE